LLCIYLFIYLFEFLENKTKKISFFLGNSQDNSRSYINVRLQSRDEQSHQVGRDINLQCTVQGSVERPYEYTYTKDGQPLGNSKIRCTFLYENIFFCI
jgi:hypothetical protein